MTNNKIILICTAIIWGVFLVNGFLLNDSLNSYGIQPRSLTGLWGVLCAPFLHASLMHIISNTISFAILGSMVLIRQKSHFLDVTIMATLVSGLGVWLIGSHDTVHIGASAVVFGYFGFLVTYGWFSKNIMSIIISLIVGFLYGGMIWGVLPLRPGISWEGHLLGFIGGVIAAKLIAKDREQEAV